MLFKTKKNELAMFLLAGREYCVMPFFALKFPRIKPCNNLYISKLFILSLSEADVTRVNIQISGENTKEENLIALSFRRGIVCISDFIRNHTSIFFPEGGRSRMYRWFTELIVSGNCRYFFMLHPLKPHSYDRNI